MNADLDALDSLEETLQTAQMTGLHLRNTLDHSYTNTMENIKSSDRSRRKKRRNIKDRNKRKSCARSEGPETSAKLRQEHSYGKLI